MDQLHAHKRRAQLLAFMVILFAGASTAAAYKIGLDIFPDNQFMLVGSLLLYIIVQAGLLAWLYADYATEPLDYIWRAVVHVSPRGGNVPAPNLDNARVARDLVTNIVLQVYEMASSNETLQSVHIEKKDTTALISEQIANNVPLPLLAVDAKQNIVFANESALIYLGMERSAVVGNNIYSVLDLMFSDEDTLDKWLQNCRTNKATATQTWRRIRLTLADQQTVKQFDMAAYYNKANTTGIETILTLFDQTERYLADDHSVDFMALAVHELRTPLTILRGYIEVFEDELDGQLSQEYRALVHQMHAAALQLTAFVNNILNVARIQEGHLQIELREEKWSDIIKSAVDDLTLTASVYGKKINFTVDPNLPSVAADKISITEVINNLVDNAVKYSGNSREINIHSSISKDGMIETTVSDNGVGIPQSIIPHLFEKFRRNYRNQAQIGGTGLGLFLCSELVQAHGGNIWVKSKEGEGTTVGFTLQPYQQLADSQKTSNNTDITRTAHGWIKNHSLYRR